MDLSLVILASFCSPAASSYITPKARPDQAHVESEKKNSPPKPSLPLPPRRKRFRLMKHLDQTAGHRGSKIFLYNFRAHSQSPSWARELEVSRVPWKILMQSWQWQTMSPKLNRRNSKESLKSPSLTVTSDNWFWSCHKYSNVFYCAEFFSCKRNSSSQKSTASNLPRHHQKCKILICNSQVGKKADIFRVAFPAGGKSHRCPPLRRSKTDTAGHGAGCEIMRDELSVRKERERERKRETERERDFYSVDLQARDSTLNRTFCSISLSWPDFMFL